MSQSSTDSLPKDDDEEFYSCDEDNGSDRHAALPGRPLPGSSRVACACAFASSAPADSPRRSRQTVAVGRKPVASIQPRWGRTWRGPAPSPHGHGDEHPP